jgi:DNA processing protein
LIQDGAKLVTETNDIIEELGPGIREKLSDQACESQIEAPSPSPLESDEQRVLDALAAEGVADANRLVARAQLPPDRVTAALVGLEIKGEIRSLPGGIYRAKPREKWPRR